jgi:hypothetical protein
MNTATDSLYVQLEKTSGGVKIGQSASDLVAFHGSTPTDQCAAMTAQFTTITHTAPGTPDYAIQNLTTSSPYGFVTADEGNTVLKVIANLQARLLEVEAILEEKGLCAAN